MQEHVNENSYTHFAEVYDELMGGVDYDEWADYLHGLICARVDAAKTLVDCACGTGELSVRLAKEGYTVTGVDISEQMLEVAQAKAYANALNIPFVCQDICNFLLHKSVDVVNCACDGVNYILTRKRLDGFFASARRALRGGGLLLFDVSSKYKLRGILGTNTFAVSEDPCPYIWENCFDEVTGVIDMHLTGFIKRGDVYSRFDEFHKQKAYTEAELVCALRDNGFINIEVFNAFTANTPGTDSERLQFAAKAP